MASHVCFAIAAMTEQKSTSLADTCVTRCASWLLRHCWVLALDQTADESLTEIVQCRHAEPCPPHNTHVTWPTVSCHGNASQSTTDWRATCSFSLQNVTSYSPPTLTFELDLPKFNYLVFCGQGYDCRSLVTIGLELAPESCSQTYYPSSMLTTLSYYRLLFMDCKIC